MTVETCLNDFDKISAAYWAHIRSYITISKFLQVANKTLIQEVAELNANIDDGPVKCRRYILNERTDFIDKMYEICADDELDNFQADPQVLKDFKQIPHDFMQSNSYITRERYCPVTVKYLNTASRLKNMVQDIVDALKSCKFLNRFDEEFKKPWRDCVEHF